MRTVTMFYDEPETLGTARHIALMHGVTTFMDDADQGYLDFVFPANESGVRKYLKIMKVPGEQVAVVDTPIDMGPERTPDLADWVRRAIGGLPNGVRRK